MGSPGSGCLCGCDERFDTKTLNQEPGSMPDPGIKSCGAEPASCSDCLWSVNEVDGALVCKFNPPTMVVLDDVLVSVHSVVEPNNYCHAFEEYGEDE